ncbi:MAG: hypothetical protein K6C99_06225 [Lachnospiraceae bacterium]|nr:hypothetical protein [Lachnospiraceae bacterium]
MILPRGVDEKKFEHCKEVVRGVIGDDEELSDKTQEILIIIYSIGQDYTDGTVETFAWNYV